MAALSYMQRRASGTYEFRKRLPESLAGRPAPSHMRDDFSDLINAKTGHFKRELVRSLATKNLNEAKRRDHQEALKASELFDVAVKALAPSAVAVQPVALELKQLGDDVFADLLANDEAERMEGDDRRHLQMPEDRAQWPTLVDVPPNTQIGMTPDHFYAYGELLSDLEDDYRAAYAQRDPKIVYPETTRELQKRGIHLSKSSPEFQRAALVVLEAHVRAYDAIGKRQRGEIIPTPIAARESTEELGSRFSKKLGPRLSEALSSWAAGGSAHNAKKPNANTVKEAQQAVRYLKELYGDLPLGEIDREKAREFRDAVAKVPASLPRDLRKLPLPELLKRDLSGFRPRMATTVNKIVQVLGGIISRAENEGFLDKVPGFVNPFGKAIRFSIDSHQTRRRHFEKSDLKAIFTSPVYAENERPAGGGGEAAFWFPLIGLLSGMRLDEIAQLRDGKLTFEVSDGVKPMQLYKADALTVEGNTVLIPLSPRPSSCKLRDRWLEEQKASCCTPKNNQPCCG